MHSLHLPTLVTPLSPRLPDLRTLVNGPGGLVVTGVRVTSGQAAGPGLGSFIRDEVLAVPIFLDVGGVKQLVPIFLVPAGLLGRDTESPELWLTIEPRNTEPELEPTPESRLDLSSAALSNSLAAPESENTIFSAEDNCPEPTLELFPVTCGEPVSSLYNVAYFHLMNFMLGTKQKTHN